ncbi:uncharacterized protein J4E87_009882 [Alternaria ethzedia]|uniref:uncharacterized protein n=1 Tax=Alternaria ethzedia TaxID=181014 RepID=UPI0020C1FF72|nr:uncharacterized protein J4E87_009882 [Alternaria ethzedia]KAI4613415.1 hypothetical protein J4E87_009882 [Alternaria ethzedia]
MSASGPPKRKRRKIESSVNPEKSSRPEKVLEASRLWPDSGPDQDAPIPEWKRSFTVPGIFEDADYSGAGEQLPFVFEQMKTAQYGIEPEAHAPDEKDTLRVDPWIKRAEKYSVSSKPDDIVAEVSATGSKVSPGFKEDLLAELAPDEQYASTFLAKFAALSTEPSGNEAVTPRATETAQSHSQPETGSPVPNSPPTNPVHGDDDDYMPMLGDEPTSPGDGQKSRDDFQILAQETTSLKDHQRIVDTPEPKSPQKRRAGRSDKVTFAPAKVQSQQNSDQDSDQVFLNSFVEPSPKKKRVQGAERNKKGPRISSFDDSHASGRTTRKRKLTSTTLDSDQEDQTEAGQTRSSRRRRRTMPEQSSSRPEASRKQKHASTTLDSDQEDQTDADQTRSSRRRRRTTPEQSGSSPEASPKPQARPTMRKTLVPVAASTKLAKQPVLPSLFRDRKNKTWVSPKEVGVLVARHLEEESRKLAKSNNNWREFARLVKRDDRLQGQYCVQCNVISHAKDKCTLKDHDEACAKCIKSGRACSKLIELDGVMHIGWLPLPAEARPGARLEELPYWVPHQEL